MKFDFSRLFEAYTDPESSVTSYILAKKAAPVQQSFYHVNTTISMDNRFYWFYCAFPPSGSREYGRTLGVLDLQEQTVTHFPDTMFDNASPLVDPDSGGVYWCTHNALCYRSPFVKDKAEVIALLPEELYGKRIIRRVATHLTFSPDKTEVFIDSLSGDTSFAGTIDLSSGKLSVWKIFERDLKHAQYCPANKDLVMLGQDNYFHPISGEHASYENRIWLLSRNGNLRPLFTKKTKLTHEWWDMDGEHIFAVNNYDQFDGPGIIRINSDTSEVKTVLSGQFWHGMNFKDKYLAYDKTIKGFFRGCPSSIHFLNRMTKKEITVISNNPEHHTPPSIYHIDPHPHFSADGSLYLFTTTVRGQVDIALVPTKELLDRTC